MYPKKVPEDMFHPLEVLRWQFNDLLSLRRFSLSSGSDMSDEADTAGSHIPNSVNEEENEAGRHYSEHPNSVAFGQAAEAGHFL